MSVSGSRALVTGASSGIGAATASLLATAGCRLVLVGRDEARLGEVARRTGGQPVVADLAAGDGVDRVVAAGHEVDLLVNNAGVGWAGELVRMGPQDVFDVVSTNLTAPLQLTRAVLPAMRQRAGGHVVFISSIAAVGVHDEAVYAASKAGLRTFAASLRYETAAHGIGVTTVLPGAVRTPFFAGRGRAYDRRFPRQVDPEQVARGLVRAVERGTDEVFVPRWLTLAARVQGALPEVFHLLARRYG